MSSEGDTSTIRLLPSESRGMIFAPPITTISFFKGSIPVDSIKARLNEIVKANPWLLSRYVNSAELNDTVCKYPNEFTAAHVDRCFETIVNANISKDMSYESLLKEVGSARLPNGIACVDKDITLFKVTLIDIKPNEEFAIVMSLSHGFADGHTFYQVYAMLDINAPIKALHCDRLPSYNAQLANAVGMELIQWLREPSFGQGIYKTIGGPLPKVCAYSLNKDEIARIKAEHTAASDDNNKSDYVTTNDIVCSWYFNLCHNTHGLLVVNFRNRFEGLTKDHAGNYHINIVYDAKDYSSPSSIRKQLATFNKGGAMPSVEQTQDFNLGIISNWSSFYQHVEVGSDCKFVAQVPIYNIDQAFRDTCFVFNLDAETPCVLLLTRSVDIVELVENKDSSVAILKNRLF